jgi:hypothetical protein
MKGFTVTFSPFAMDDLEKAVEYYEEKHTSMGKRFATQLQLTLNTIKPNLFFATVRYDDMCCAGIKKFLTWYTITSMKMNC